MNRWFKLLIEIIILIIVCLICVYVPQFLIVYFGLSTSSSISAIFVGGMIFAYCVSYSNNRKFKKEAVEGFGKAIMEQQEHYRDTLIGLSDEVITRLKEADNDNKNNKRPV